MGGTPATGLLEADIILPPALGAFSERELDGLPEPVRRYVRTSIAPGAPLAAPEIADLNLQHDRGRER